MAIHFCPVRSFTYNMTNPMPFPESQGKYDIILADPPWMYKRNTFDLKNNSPGKDKDTGGAGTHYQTLSQKQLKQIEVGSLAQPDCLLFMWSSSPHLNEAIALGESWGFSYKTVAFCWEKQRAMASFYTVSSIELCLVFKKGRIPRPRGSRKERQFISQKRSQHSEKPAEVRERISRMFPDQRKIELFSRHVIDGWDRVGNQVIDPPKEQIPKDVQDSGSEDLELSSGDNEEQYS